MCLYYLFNQVNYALSLNQTHHQWVDLGIHTEACMTQPETCGAAGGAISLWLNIMTCDLWAGFVSSYIHGRTGFHMLCSANDIGYDTENITTIYLKHKLCTNLSTKFNWHDSICFFYHNVEST